MWLNPHSIHGFEHFAYINKKTSTHYCDIDEVIEKFVENSNLSNSLTAGSFVVSISLSSVLLYDVSVVHDMRFFTLGTKLSSRSAVVFCFVTFPDDIPYNDNDNQNCVHASKHCIVQPLL